MRKWKKNYNFLWKGKLQHDKFTLTPPNPFCFLFSHSFVQRWLLLPSLTSSSSLYVEEGIIFSCFCLAFFVKWIVGWQSDSCFDKLVSFWLLMEGNFLCSDFLLNYICSRGNWPEEIFVCNWSNWTGRKYSYGNGNSLVIICEVFPFDK